MLAVPRIQGSEVWDVWDGPWGPAYLDPRSRHLPLWERSEGGIFIGERGAGSGRLGFSSQQWMVLSGNLPDLPAGHQRWQWKMDHL